MNQKLAALAVALLIPVSGCAGQMPDHDPVQASPVAAEKNVFVIRHLQKGEGADPSLSAQGAANAQRLAAMLKDEGIVAIFATPTRRAMETGAPLAKALGIAVTPYDPSNIAMLAAQVKAAAGPVLIVGHSNTVPDLVALFGGTRPAPLSEEDYGILFEVGADGDVTTAAVR
ncbi:MAG TPA: histidine phosphatase family protein [Sphingomicrobium sp.]|jgi:broad specificity phosphatase PhoE|nr:histidine phosphatase family protein [Sphingomicrobium sp.]